MALEQFKTQVLLLHSQQSTLDALGAGFSVNDKYAVHFATSGSEALNTLGETPIHVIVSAQDLPGMSGLEALREAKKRSPDTIGILLAGSDRDDGLEALVGDREVFQIVRGTVSADALLNIIETATKRVRLLALSESANDTAANVDHAAPESTGEHIIMETDDNGATIISDGTGRMPALRPDKIHVSPNADGRNVDILVLTKDEEFLSTIRDSSRGMHTVHHAHTAAQAQDIVRQHKVGVLVTDAAIAGSKVQGLTQALRRDQPRLVAVVAGRRDDGELLMDLINQGQVYRFLLKPVSPGRTRLAIEASVKHHLDAPDATFKRQASAAAPASARPAPPKSPPTKPAPAKPAAAKPAATPATATAAAPPAKPAARTTPQPAAAKSDDLGSSGRRKTPVIGALDGSKPEHQPAAPAGLGLDSDALGDEQSNRLPLFGAAAAAVVLIALGVWIFSGDSADEPVPETSTAATVPSSVDDSSAQPAAATVSENNPPAATTDTASAPADTAAHIALLDDARFARDAGRIVTPAGDNAMEYYVAARNAAPDNEAIAEELGALTEQVLGMTEAALLDNRAEDAAAALDRLALADADSSRLTFLTAQLAQLQLRKALDDSRLAIRELRYEDAAGLLARAQRLAGQTSPEVEQLLEDLATARSAQQVDDVLVLANERLAADRLTAPANDNARYYFELALDNDPENIVAQQGLDVIASKLVLRARSAIDGGELEQAASLLDEARGLNPDSSDLQASVSALTAAREQQADAERAAASARQEAQRRAEAERLATLQRRNAASATLTTAGEDASAVNASPAPESGASLAPVATSDTDKQTAAAAKPGGADSGSGETATAPPAATADTANAAGEGPRVVNAQNDAFVAISELVRINYVAPEYPRAAQRRNMSGYVDVEFTVTPRGTVADVAVRDSSPGTIFNDVATEAVSQWRFEPVIENGAAVSKRAAVRMAFNLQ